MNIGVDIEEVDRVKRLIRNPRFLKRVFTSQEIAYCRQKKNQAQHFAVRFAAKEAVWKAVNETMARSKFTLSHRDIGIRNTSLGKPEVVLPARFSKWQKKICLSLSHTRAYAVAVALMHA